MSSLFHSKRGHAHPGGAKGAERRRCTARPHGRCGRQVKAKHSEALPRGCRTLSAADLGGALTQYMCHRGTMGAGRYRAGTGEPVH